MPILVFSTPVAGNAFCLAGSRRSKGSDFYGPLFPGVPDDLDQVWPGTVN
jgi:hypothetical protein